MLIKGVVGRGKARGRKLGFPTANIDLGKGPAQIEGGVHVGWARWDTGPVYGALVNVGNRPTFGEGEWAIEVHVLDFCGDLYGKTMEVQLIHHLRPERAFGDAEALKRQIANDIEKARDLLNEASAKPFALEE